MTGYKIMCNVWTNDRSDYITGEYEGAVYGSRENATEVMAKARAEHPEVDFYIEEAEL